MPWPGDLYLQYGYQDELVQRVIQLGFLLMLTP